MEHAKMVTTRRTAFAALFFAALMFGVPSFFMGQPGADIVIGAEAQGLDVERDFVIAIGELTVDTLNPNTYTMASEGYVIFPAYSTLLTYDVNTNVIGDLARYWDVSPDGLDWYFRLVEDAFFIDPRAPDVLNRQVTAEDVAWSFYALQNNSDSRLHFYFPNELGDDKIPLIESISYPTDYDLYINLSMPFAPVFDSWTGAPVFPKYYWEGEDFINFENDPVIGSGAYYVEYVEETSAVLQRNNHWYMTENYGWQVHFDTVTILEELNDDLAMEKLGDGDVDCQMRIPPKKYLDVLPTIDNTIGFSASAGFVYEFNLNQMTDELRAELGGSVTAGKNNQLLLNETVKEAITMCINKTEFVTNTTYGLGSVSNSLVPESSPWLYEIPEDVLVKPDKAAARKLLNDAGWVYDEDEKYNPGATPLWRMEDGELVDELRFGFLTLDTAPEWQVAALDIVNWTGAAGVQLDLSIKSVSQMNTAWYAADYDIWLWDWIFGVLQEASGVLEVLTTMSIGQSSDIYWSNATFDALYNASLIEMDPVKRGEIYNEMQLMAYKNMGCQPVAYSNDNYGVSTVNWAPESLGDWNNTYMLLPDVSFQWIGMRAYPNQNYAPQFTYDPVDVAGLVSTPLNFSVSAYDDCDSTPLSFRWFWGDGDKSDWRPGGTGEGASDMQDHVYTRDGEYTVWVAVREAGPSMNDDFGSEMYDDNFTTVTSFKVTVRDESNGPPENVDFSWTPLNPDAGDLVKFTATAEDPENDDLYYTWDFGGGHILSGEEVEFQFGEEGYFSVTVSVDDKRLGVEGTRPVVESKSMYVARNNAPRVDVPSYLNIPKSTLTQFDITAEDDEDDIVVTWLWGDGSTTVTSGDTASHTYSNLGYYTMTVWVDDQTGLPGHNLSDSCEVYVYNPSQNVPPTIVEFIVVGDTEVFTGESVTFRAKALDEDGDPLELTIEYGDGDSDVQSFAASAPNTVREAIFVKEYATSGYPTAYLYVDDGTKSTTSEGIEITVSANFEPELDPLEDVYGDTGASTDFEAVATDFDGDDLTYYWEWGDGETTTVVNDGLASHVYEDSGDYDYAVWVDDGSGHNVTDSATAYINTVPVLEDLPSFTIDAGVSYTFTAEATDADDDTLEYTWWFEESDEYISGNDISHSFATEGVWDYTVWADDDFPLDSHNVSTTGVVTVQPGGVNDPPWILPIQNKEVTVNEAITLVAQIGDPDGDTLTITWDFGDGEWAYESTKSVSHTYTVENTSPGYTVVVYADDGEYNVSEDFLVVVVADTPPTAVADVPSFANEDVDVTFDGSDSTDDVPPLASWEWYIVELDDTVTGETAVYNFPDPGVFTVELTVTDSIGQTDTDTATITIRDTTDPVAVADADDTDIDMGDSVTFDGSGSSDNSGTVVSYEWEFFDGVSLQVLSGESVTHTFDVAGSYPVTLTVEDAAGNSGTDDTLTIIVRDTEDPVADAGDDQTIDAGVEVTFDAAGSDDNVGIVEFTWSFDYDGTPQELDGATAAFTFDIAGTYVVTLTVADAAGNSDTDTVTITVNAAVANQAPVADAGDDQDVTIGATVTLDGSGSADPDGTIVNWTWTFTFESDAKELFGETVTFDFDVVGTYTVTLTVTDDDDATDTDTMVVTVTDVAPTNDPPVANAGADQTVTVGEEVSFNGAGSSDDVAVVNYTWTFTYDGDPVTLYGVSPDFTFEVEGTYTVTLTVADAEGQTDSDTVVVTVEAEEDGTDDDDKKSFLESYGLPLGIVIALIVAALVLFFVMKGRKGGKSGEQQLDGLSAGEPEVPEDQS